MGVGSGSTVGQEEWELGLGGCPECTQGRACPRDIPELFWEVTNLAGGWFANHPDMLVFLMRQSVLAGDSESLYNPKGCAILNTAMEKAQPRSLLAKPRGRQAIHNHAGLICPGLPT